MNRRAALVGIVMGSDHDLPIMEEAASILEAFAVGHDLTVASAHRSPQRARRYATAAVGRGLRVIIVGAGGAAHLAGVMAAHTTLPVIAVPIPSSPLGGMDALLSSVQMPAGVPVAVMAVGKAGASNAALLAVQILALSNADLQKRLLAYKKRLADQVQLQAKRLGSRRGRQETAS